MLQSLSMTYIEVRNLSEQWCEEAGIDRGDTWHYPFQPDAAMTVTQVMWRMIEERQMTTVQGMRLYFDRYVRAINAQ